MSQPESPRSLLELLAAAPASRTAVVLPEAGIRVSYGSLRAQVARTADAFAAAGIGRQDRVAIVLPNGLPLIVCFLAAAAAGTAAPLNPGYRQEEFSFSLADTDARLLVLPPDGGAEARRAAGGRIPVLTAALDQTGEVEIEGRTAGHSAGAPSPDDVALVLHTSGSTGRPKRVPLRHRNLAASAGTIAGTYALGEADVSLCVMPLFHVHGLVASVLATLASGGTVVVPARFNPLAFWRTVGEQRVTWYSAVPTIHQLLLARAGRERPAGAASLRFVRSCSAALPVEAARRLEEVVGAPVLEAYGMTEAAHQMASNPLPPRPRKFGTVGPATGVRIGIAAADGHPRPAGEPGEVVIRGPGVIHAYEDNPDANRSSFVDGWFRTGDQGVLDADGYLSLLGRIKELINRGGEKVAPPEVDAVLLAHAAVAEAVCFGIPHPTLGEEVAAAVVLRQPASEAELLAHCRDRIAEFKCPKRIYVVETIPRTATGKIQRRAVAAAFAEPGR
jgi:acyl-CoA synthetase (AMP-forming)/AMP-acid ligase II